MQINPVIEKELKVKMRGWRSPLLISVYLGFLGLVVFLFYLTTSYSSRYGGNVFNPTVALTIYNTLAVIQFILLMFITPALISGAVSSEREKQTLDLLLCTNFSPFSIIMGKVVVSIAHILLLITASLPIMATVFLYGGVNFLDLLLLFGFYLVTALMLASVGIFFSTVFKRSSVSTIMTYLTVGFLTVGTIIIFVIWGMVHLAPNNSQPSYTEVMSFLFANPLFAFSSVISGNSSGGSFMSIFYQLRTLTNTPPVLFGIEIHPWMLNMLFNLLISALFIFLSSRRITPVRGSLFGRKGKKNYGNTPNIQDIKTPQE